MNHTPAEKETLLARARAHRSAYRRAAQDGRRAAENRGHDMPPLHLVYKGASSLWMAQCRYCRMHLAVTPNPQPNEVRVGGDAVALNCRREPR